MRYAYDFTSRYVNSNINNSAMLQCCMATAFAAGAKYVINNTQK